MNRRRDAGTGWRRLTNFWQLEAHADSDRSPSLGICPNAQMVVDGEPGIAGDTKLFGKRLAAVKAGGLFQPPAKDTAAHLLEDLALQRPAAEMH